jgi:mannose-6-phosphate isomerase-like protein (cupin superfamily)
MSETLHIGTHEDLTVIRADAGVFEVEATYRPHGASPPPHLHPGQDEHFAVLDGALHVVLGRQARELAAGQELTIARGQVHRMWNQGGQPALGNAAVCLLGLAAQITRRDRGAIA